MMKYHQDRKKNKDGRIKIKEAANIISKIFRLSEDYDSDDSSDDEEFSWLLKRKSVSKRLKKLKHDDLAIDGKYIKLAHFWLN